MTPLGESITKTLVYFSQFGYPLTKEELFAYLWQPPRVGFEEFLHFLSIQDKEKIQEKYSYLFKAGNADFAENRRRAALFAEQKMKIALRAAKKIRSIPFLQSIFVCNSVGLGVAKEESDIDFFIITAPRRIWLVRFFSNIILRLYGMRTYGKRIKNKICLSFYVDNNNLNLRSLCSVDQDIHFMYWINQMIPIYDSNDNYRRFLSANDWALKYLPNVTRLSQSDYLFRINNVKISGLWKRIWEKMWHGAYGDLLEKQAKGIQSQRFKSAIKEAAVRNDKSVVLSDTVLKFHENDRRKEIFEKWKRLLISNDNNI